MEKFLVLLWISLLSTNLFAGYPQPTRPNPHKTPGDLCNEADPDFSGYRYDQRIPYCTRNVSRGFKNGIYRDYGVPLKAKGKYTIDHLIPLSIGGSNNAENLWPEPKAIKRLREELEYDVYMAVRMNEITQKEAIEVILEAKFNPPINE